MGDTGINPKLPSWDGDWKTFADYKLACWLEHDGLKQDEQVTLAPRLARNLTGKAWEACLEIEREKLRKEGGLQYLLDYLKGKRGKQQVDILGEAFEKYFQSGEVMRRDKETLNDYEQRLTNFTRDIERALKELGTDVKVPTEIYGWFLLNKHIRLEPSDIATLKSQTASYKLSDVLSALRKMWGGDSLCLKDQERRRVAKAYLALQEYEDEADEDGGVWWNDEGEDDDTTEVEPSEAEVYFEETLAAHLENPEDEMILANFQEAKRTFYKDARKALDQSRVNRGFYPKGKGKGKDRAKGGGRTGEFPGRCMRCGKYGHKAQACPQAGDGKGGGSGKGAGVGFVYTNWTDSSATSQKQLETAPEAIFVQKEPETMKAIMDCGASESIVGAWTLQNLSDELARLGFDTEAEIQIDSKIRKNFIFGNNATSTALGLAKVTAGIHGQERAIKMHVVEGGTPMLLSSKWLYDQEAIIDFKRGQAILPKISSEVIQLERALMRNRDREILRQMHVYAAESAREAQASNEGSSDKDTATNHDPVGPQEDPEEVPGEPNDPEAETEANTWKTNLETKLRTIHANLGHPSNQVLVRVLKEAGASKEIIEKAQQYSCPQCNRRGHARPHRTSQIPHASRKWEVVSVDTFWWHSPHKDEKGNPLEHVVGISLMDEASDFHVASIVRTGIRTQKVISSSEFKETFCKDWLRNLPKPEALRFDDEGAFRDSQTIEWIEGQAIRVSVIAGEAAWQVGKHSRHLEVLKENMSLLAMELGPEEALQRAEAARRQLVYFYRKGRNTSRMEAGWHGPARVVAVEKQGNKANYRDISQDLAQEPEDSEIHDDEMSKQEVLSALKGKAAQEQKTSALSLYEQEKERCMEMSMEALGNETVKHGKHAGKWVKEAAEDNKYVIWLMEHHEKNVKFTNLLTYIVRANSDPCKKPTAKPYPKSTAENSNDMPRHIENEDEWFQLWEQEPDKELPGSVTKMVEVLQKTVRDLSLQVGQLEQANVQQQQALYQAMSASMGLQEEMERIRVRLAQIEAAMIPTLS
ncbi:unnamed protein product [Symbiodinium sp. CCMP2592]|nr:unnamed protein product [Symbiodinium sp. CCMP2592]